MSHTPEYQYLEPAVRKVREAFDDFHARAQARLDAGTDEWNVDHLRELAEIRARMIQLDTDLSIILKGTQ